MFRQALWHSRSCPDRNVPAGSVAQALLPVLLHARLTSPWTAGAGVPRARILRDGVEVPGPPEREFCAMGMEVPSPGAKLHSRLHKSLAASERECFPTPNKCQGPTSVGPKDLHNKFPCAAGPRAAKRSALSEFKTWCGSSEIQKTDHRHFAALHNGCIVHSDN